MSIEVTESLCPIHPQKLVCMTPLPNQICLGSHMKTLQQQNAIQNSTTPKIPNKDRSSGAFRLLGSPPPIGAQTRRHLQAKPWWAGGWGSTGRMTLCSTTATSSSTSLCTTGSPTLTHSRTLEPSVTNPPSSLVLTTLCF